MKPVSKFLLAVAMLPLVGCTSVPAKGSKLDQVQAVFSTWRTKNGCDTAICVAEVSDVGDWAAFIGISRGKEGEIVIGAESTVLFSLWKKAYITKKVSAYDLSTNITSWSSLLKNLEIKRNTLPEKHDLSFRTDSTDRIIVIKNGPNLEVFQRLGWAEEYNEAEIEKIIDKVKRWAK